MLAGGLRGGGAFIFGGVDTLHTVGAFFHDASAAKGDLRIMRAGRFFTLLLGIVSEIEDACVVGARCGTITRSPATGVYHGIQAGRGVHGGVDRAHGFARRFLTLAAGGGHIV